MGDKGIDGIDGPLDSKPKLESEQEPAKNDFWRKIAEEVPRGQGYHSKASLIDLRDHIVKKIGQLRVPLQDEKGASRRIVDFADYMGSQLARAVGEVLRDYQLENSSSNLDSDFDAEYNACVRKGTLVNRIRNAICKIEVEAGKGFYVDDTSKPGKLGKGPFGFLTMDYPLERLVLDVKIGRAGVFSKDSESMFPIAKTISEVLTEYEKKRGQEQQRA